MSLYKSSKFISKTSFITVLNICMTSHICLVTWTLPSFFLKRKTNKCLKMRSYKDWLKLKNNIRLCYQNYVMKSMKNYGVSCKPLIELNKSSRIILTKVNKSWLQLKRSFKRTIGMIVLISVLKKLVKKAKKSLVTYAWKRILLLFLLFSIREKESKNKSLKHERTTAIKKII